MLNNKQTSITWVAFSCYFVQLVNKTRPCSHGSIYTYHRALYSYVLNIFVNFFIDTGLSLEKGLLTSMHYMSNCTHSTVDHVPIHCRTWNAIRVNHFTIRLVQSKIELVVLTCLLINQIDTFQFKYCGVFMKWTKSFISASSLLVCSRRDRIAIVYVGSNFIDIYKTSVSLRLWIPLLMVNRMSLSSPFSSIFSDLNFEFEWLYVCLYCFYFFHCLTLLRYLHPSAVIIWKNCCVECRNQFEQRVVAY